MSGEKKFYIGIVLVTVGVLAGIILASDKENERVAAPLEGIEEVAQPGRHVPRGSLDNTEDPPTSGEHYGDGVAGAGIHKEAVDDGLTVHSMEHGAVVLNYDPAVLSKDEIKIITDMFTDKFKGKKIMLPRENMTVPIIMTSWGQILKLESIDEEKMVSFMNTNNDRGPEKVASY